MVISLCLSCLGPRREHTFPRSLGNTKCVIQHRPRLRCSGGILDPRRNIFQLLAARTGVFPAGGITQRLRTLREGRDAAGDTTQIPWGIMYCDLSRRTTASPRQDSLGSPPWRTLWYQVCDGAGVHTCNPHWLFSCVCICSSLSTCQVAPTGPPISDHSVKVHKANTGSV